jgi:uncharacterized membrane protein YhaH (DUF805 family)
MLPLCRGHTGPPGGQVIMGFADAIRSVLTNYAKFDGRARRSEYWYFFLFNIIVSIVAGVIDAAIGSPVLAIIVTLALLVPGIAVGCRRLHDIGKSGWWLLIGLVPLVGAILLIVWFATDSKPAGDKYGPSPKYGNAGGTAQVPPPGYGQAPPPGYGQAPPPPPGYGPPR